MTSNSVSMPFTRLTELVDTDDFKRRLLCLYKRNFNGKLERQIQDMLADALNGAELPQHDFHWFTEVEEVDLVCIGPDQLYPATNNNIEIKYQFPYDLTRGLKSTCCQHQFSFSSREGLVNVIHVMEGKGETDKKKREALHGHDIGKILADIFLPKKANRNTIATNFILIVHERTGFDTECPSDGMYNERGIYPAMLQKAHLRSSNFKRHIRSPMEWLKTTQDFVCSIEEIMKQKEKKVYCKYKSLAFDETAGRFKSKFHFWFMEFVD